MCCQNQGSSNMEHGRDPAQTKAEVFAGKTRTGLSERWLCKPTAVCLYRCTWAFYVFQPGFKDLTCFCCTTVIYLTPARCICLWEWPHPHL